MSIVLLTDTILGKVFRFTLAANDRNDIIDIERKYLTISKV